MIEKAIAKLKDDLGTAKKGGRKEAVMVQPILDTLVKFCREDGEFAQAVVEGGSLTDCVRSVAKAAGSAISDIKAYTLAVQFYFPGAEIRVTMEIDLIGQAGLETEQKSVRTVGEKKSITIDLMDFL